MRKQRFTFALVMTMLMMVLSPTRLCALTGNGSSSSPYQISTATDLKTFADIVNGTNGQTQNASAYAKLNNDITLSGTWTPLGTTKTPYAGTFYGNDHTISGIRITATADNAGFFGCISGGTVRDLTLEGSLSSSYNNVGSVVGYAKTFTSLYEVRSSMNITITGAKDHIGGLVGNMEGTSYVKGCVYSGTLDAGSSKDSNGGIVGFAHANCSGYISYCFFNGTLKTTGSGPQMGGILGYVNDEDKNFEGVHDCYSCGKLIFSGSNTYANAIVGRIRARSVTTVNNTFLSGTATRACNEDCADPVDFTVNKAITISVKAGTGGSVKWDYVNPGQSTPVQIKADATAAEHYNFSKWSDGNTTVSRTVGLTNNVDLTAQFTGKKYTITVQANNSSYGTVTGGGSKTYNTTTKLVATPNTGYQFVKWSDGNTNQERTVTVTGNATYEAQFEAKTITITVKSANTDQGTVTGGGSFKYGTSQTITATPKTGYSFDKWNDGNTENPRVISVPASNTTYTANFIVKKYELTVSTDGNGTVTGAGTYAHNTSATLTATPDDHYHFLRWSDGNTTNPRKVTMTANTSLTAYFALDTHTITWSCEGGEGSVTQTNENGKYEYGASYSIKAVPGEHYKFVRWKEVNTSSNPYTSTATQDKHYTAVFAPKQYTVYTYYYNEGSITYSINGNTYESTSGVYDALTEITFTAIPGEHHHFDKWNDGSTDNPHTVVLTGNLNMGTIFAKDKYPVTVVAEPEGAGRVQGSTCAYGESTVVTAFANPGYEFAGWSDNGSTENYHSVSVTGPTTLTANFRPQQYNLTVQSNDETWGTVTGGGVFGYNTVHTIQAIPNEGYEFSYWSDGVTDPTRDVTVGSSGNTYKAFFTPIQYTIHVAANDDNYGTVTGGGVFNSGNLITIKAKPQDGYVFKCWNDGNTEPSREVAVSGNATYTATFVHLQAYFADGTLTLYADNNEHEGTPYKVSLNNLVQCKDIASQITSVVFDPSFAIVYPTTLSLCFDGLSNLTSITGLEYLNTDNVISMFCMFRGCSSLQSLDVSHFNTEKVTDMRSMFDLCSSLKSLDVSHFNTGEVTNMNSMFNLCSSLKSLDVSHFNTEKVTDMQNMFRECSSLQSLDLSHFNTEKVTDMSFMFYQCPSLQSLDVSHFNTEKVTNMSFMFSECSSLESLDVSHFNTEQVTDMNYMFDLCSSLQSLDLSHFNTGEVTRMISMFYQCSSLESLDVSHFNTEKVTNMNSMFYQCSSLESLDVSHFNTEQVTDMKYMFRGCSSLQSLDLSHFNTEKVTYMEGMFRECSKLNELTIGNFDMRAVTERGDMFQDCPLTTLTLKSLPYLADNTFNNIISVTTVNYELDDNSVIYVGENHLPAATSASYTRPEVEEGDKCTFIMPFDVPAASAAKFGTFYTYDRIEDGTAYFEKVEGDLQANTPYFFTPVKDVLTLNVANANVASPASMPDVANLTVPGLYGAYDCTALPANAYVYDGADTFDSEATEGKSYRAYLWLPDTDLSVLPVVWGTGELLAGDVNGDGRVSMADLVLLVEILNGRATDTNGTADVDGQDGVTKADVQALKNILLNR